MNLDLHFVLVIYFLKSLKIKTTNPVYCQYKQNESLLTFCPRDLFFEIS